MREKRPSAGTGECVMAEIMTCSWSIAAGEEIMDHECNYE